MRFIATELEGAYVVEPEKIEDERGFFARTFCKDEFAAQGLRADFVQCNVSFNVRKGTVRGMHFQEKPHEEAKLVRCTRGAIYDVIVDIRRESPTFRRWTAFELTAENQSMLYVPEGFAHGFQTLEDNCEIFYQMSVGYDPACFRGVRYDAPVLAIKWPLLVTVISERDRALPQPFPV